MLSRVNIKFFKMAVGSENIRKETDVDITARCPICGDSKNKNKARLHLYEKNGLELCNCFNGDCSAKNKTVYSFLRDFFPSLIGQYKRENFGSTMEKLASGEDVFGTLSSTKKEQPKKEKEVITQDLSQFLKPMNDSPQALEYIKSRGIDPIKCQEKYGKWFYGFQDLKIGETLYKITDSVVIPLYYEGEMYGFYSRLIKEKMFYTYMNDANIGYKIWNWFSVDKNKPVFIYEAIFDAISGGLPNSIALMGAKLPDERLKELKHPIFVLDADKTGIENSISYAKLGHRVFVKPPESKKDMNENLKAGINCPEMILKNLHTGISAEVRLKSLL